MWQIRDSRNAQWRALDGADFYWDSGKLTVLWADSGPVTYSAANTRWRVPERPASAQVQRRHMRAFTPADTEAIV